ncbi:hypothetical protein HN51_004786, partial [Arachis hypogaea]
ALLWHRLMGTNVLSISHDSSPYLCTYAHCSKEGELTSKEINTLNLMDSLKRKEYHLTPKDGNIQSDVVFLNGTPLKLTKSKKIPELKPKIVDPSSFSPIKVAPHSIVFVQMDDFNALACAPPTK